MSVKFKWIGLEQFYNDLKQYGDKLPPAAEAAIYQEAEQIITEAKKLTPVETGTLRRSGHVQPPIQEGPRVSVQFGFGGPAGSGNQGETNEENVGYATRVHEDLEAHHTVGQAKFLETPLKAARQTMAQRLADRISKTLKK